MCWFPMHNFIAIPAIAVDRGAFPCPSPIVLSSNSTQLFRHAFTMFYVLWNSLCYNNFISTFLRSYLQSKFGKRHRSGVTGLSTGAELRGRKCSSKVTKQNACQGVAVKGKDSRGCSQPWKYFTLGIPLLCTCSRYNLLIYRCPNNKTTTKLA